MLDCSGPPALAGTRVPVETLPPEQLRVLARLGLQLRGCTVILFHPITVKAPPGSRGGPTGAQPL